MGGKSIPHIPHDPSFLHSYTPPSTHTHTQAPTEKQVFIGDHVSVAFQAVLLEGDAQVDDAEEREEEAREGLEVLLIMHQVFLGHRHDWLLEEGKRGGCVVCVVYDI